MAIRVRGVRGATTVDVNTAEAILDATQKLLEAIVRANQIEEDDVASVIFTTTSDLNAVFPAKAGRDMGWHRTALMGAQEVDVPRGVQQQRVRAYRIIEAAMSPANRSVIHDSTVSRRDELITTRT